jgi:FkbH-like protein
MEKIALLSNINIDKFKFYLKKDYDLFLPSGYNTWCQKLLNSSSDFYTFQPQFCFLIIDGYELFLSPISNIVDEVFTCISHAIKFLPNCRFFISDLDIYNQKIYDSKKIHEDYLNETMWLERLRSLLENFGNAYFFPLKDIVINNGRNTLYSSKMWYLANSRFSTLGERMLVNKMRQLIRPMSIPSRKCLVLDLDNTLWGGIIGEDGLEGIQLDTHGIGARFYDFQKVLKAIHTKGILLAIISKNNIGDVEKAFSHSNMILQKDDFTEMVINWKSKSENIALLAKNLNFSLDALVFIDDNPVEREEMRQRQPDVIVADFPEDTSQLSQFADEIYNQYFYSWNVLQEDRERSQMYKENSQRNEAKVNFSTLEEFLIDMNIKLSIKKIDSGNILRAAQMLQKTNQFNLTTIRYSKEDLIELSSDNSNLILLGHVQDKYGNNGNSILLIARLVSKHEAEIDSFLMSCRVMNRSIEFGFLYEAEKILGEMGADIIRAKYVKTTKNEPASNFFEDAGYTVISNNGLEKQYKFFIKDVSKRNAKKSYVIIERFW